MNIEEAKAKLSKAINTDGSRYWSYAPAVKAVLAELEEKDAYIKELEAIPATEAGQQILIDAIGAHGYIVASIVQGRPDLALQESQKWVEAFSQARNKLDGGE